MAFDRSDNLFVSEYDSIFKFTSEGVKSTFVSGLQSQFGQRLLQTSECLIRGNRTKRKIKYVWTFQGLFNASKPRCFVFRILHKRRDPYFLPSAS